MEHLLIHNTKLDRYEFDLGDSTAYLSYEQEGNCLHLTHTIVPRQHEGQGIARALVEAAFHDIRKRGLRIVAHCSYVVRYVERHPEWHDIVAQ